MANHLSPSMMGFLCSFGFKSEWINNLISQKFRDKKFPGNIQARIVGTQITLEPNGGGKTLVGFSLDSPERVVLGSLP